MVKKSEKYVYFSENDFELPNNYYFSGMVIIILYLYSYFCRYFPGLYYYYCTEMTMFIVIKIMLISSISLMMYIIIVSITIIIIYSLYSINL